MKILLIIFLVVSPVDIPLEWVPRHVDNECWEALKFLAWHLELSGPKCSWIGDFRAEIRWVRLRHKECQDWPSIKESRRLPPKETCLDYIRFGEAHRDWLRSACDERLWADLSKDKRQVDVCLKFWELAKEAMTEDLFWCKRRESLQRIRSMVGEDAWHAGRWPPPAPLWNWHP